MKKSELAVEVPLAVLDDEIDINNLLMYNKEEIINTNNSYSTTSVGSLNNNNNVDQQNGNFYNNNISHFSSSTPKQTAPIVKASDDLKSINEILADLDAKNNNQTAQNLNSSSSRSSSPFNKSQDGSSSIKDKFFTDNCNTTTTTSNRNSSNNSSTNEDSDETLSGSLEDLVGHFEEKLANCLKNFAETTETLAPVQIRTQEEIMNESQIWLTLTGNFGNILPIDWSKTYTRSLQLPVLKSGTNHQDEDSLYNSMSLDLPEDESLAEAMDLHRMVSRHDDWEPPPQSADEVIEEIDEIIMQQSMNSSGFNEGDCAMMDTSVDSICSAALRSPSSYLNQYGFVGNGGATDTNCGGDLAYDIEDRLNETRRTTSNVENLSKVSYKQLTALKLELESLVDAYNENLVQELATRDELEYDKESKNTFISLLLSIQSKRRQYQAMLKKQRGSKGNNSTNNLPQYLTAVIPYNEGQKLMDSRSLQALIKILRAINDNNVDVPALLTDYILNVLCPSTTSSIVC